MARRRWKYTIRTPKPERSAWLANQFYLTHQQMRVARDGSVVRGLSIVERGVFIREEGQRCNYCGSSTPPFHVDHIRSIHWGGDSDRGNLAVACRSCNLTKGASSDRWWIEKLAVNGNERTRVIAARLLEPP